MVFVVTTIIGHRAVGVSETRLEDFQQAVDLGLKMIEFDLRMTADRQLVVYHGPPGMEGVNIIRRKTAAEVEQQVGYHLPRLSEVIDLAAGQLRFDLEVKEADILDAIIGEFSGGEHLTAGGHVITPFLDSVVAEAQEWGIPAGLILGKANLPLTARWSEIFPGRRQQQSGADFLVPERRVYNLGDRFHNHFRGAWLWGVNSDQQLRKAFADPQVAAVITDHPQRAQEILGARC